MMWHALFGTAVPAAGRGRLADRPGHRGLRLQPLPVLPHVQRQGVPRPFARGDRRPFARPGLGVRTRPTPCFPGRRRRPGHGYQRLAGSHGPGAQRFSNSEALRRLRIGLFPGRQERGRPAPAEGGGTAHGLLRARVG